MEGEITVRGAICSTGEPEFESLIQMRIQHGKHPGQYSGRIVASIQCICCKAKLWSTIIYHRDWFSSNHQGKVNHRQPLPGVRMIGAMADVS